MNGSLYLAWQYVRRHPVTTLTLVTAITLIAYLPAALQVIVDNAQEHFHSRAVSTPLVVGPRGSALELVLASAYFDRPQQAVLRYEQMDRIERQDLGHVIPLNTQYLARDCPIVGTTQAYASLRDLTVVDGTMWEMLGECVVGSQVARKLNIDVGDKLPVATQSAFTLSDAPLRLNVVGRLASTETPDDEAIFVDIETTWIVAGLGHGHADEAEHGSPEARGVYGHHPRKRWQFPFSRRSVDVPHHGGNRGAGKSEGRDLADWSVSRAGGNRTDRAPG